jgi:hypothetical protein
MSVARKLTRRQAMQFDLHSMSAWVILTGIAIAGMATIGTWRKKRRQEYSREFMQKLARSL